MSRPSDHPEDDGERRSGPPPSAREMAEREARRSETPAPARPTPVREALEREAPPSPPEAVPPERTFQDREGRRWTVRLVGRTRSGTRPDRGAPLALLHFQPAADPAQGAPDEAGEDEPLEALAVTEELEPLSEEELRGLLSRAQPVAFEPGDFFGGTRRDRRSKGRQGS